MEKSSSEMVSVIMPSYNAGKYLPRSIDSILNQSYSNLELLITDDNSDDPETLAVLKRYAEKDSRVRVYSVFQKAKTTARMMNPKATKWFQRIGSLLKTRARMTVKTVSEMHS